MSENNPLNLDKEIKKFIDAANCAATMGTAAPSEFLKNWWETPLDPGKRHRKNMGDIAELPELCDPDYDLPSGGAFLNPQEIDPLVIDLDGDGVELTSLRDSKAMFDLNNDGFAEKTGWVSKDDGLLVMDRNGNGRIDNGTELFGDQSGDANGFAQLAHLDSNKDGVIDAKDSAYKDLRVWQDLDQDGFSDAGEMKTLDEVGVKSIKLAAQEVSETNAGNRVSHRSSVKMKDGSERSVEDVWFERDPRVSYKVLDKDFKLHVDAIKLPVLFGYGQIASSFVSLSENETLRGKAKDLLTLLKEGNISAFQGNFDDYLFEWAGVNGNSDHPDVYERWVHRAKMPEKFAFSSEKLAFLEKAYGQNFENGRGGIPTFLQALRLSELYDQLTGKIEARFIAQSSISSALLEAETTDDLFGLAADHPLFSLTRALENYSAKERSLSNKDLTKVMISMKQSIDKGNLSVDSAYLAIKILQADMNFKDSAFIISAIKSGFSPDSALISHFKSHSKSNNLSVNIDDLIVIGSDNAETLTGDQYGSALTGGKGNDTLVGDDGEDVYFYSRGDGNDIIKDSGRRWDKDDHLVFKGVNLKDVKFDINSNEDLVISISNSETITVENHFDGHGLETITFADGTTLNAQAIRDKSVSDQKSSGLVQGSDHTENYAHSLGDGSYRIKDSGRHWDKDDHFKFTDANASDVKFKMNSWDDLIMTTAKGDKILVENHFDGHALETITFADGTTLNAQAIRDKSVSDQKSSGVVQGSDFTENYAHSLGDGSYRIEDSGRHWDKDDHFKFTDANASDIQFQKNYWGDLIMTTAKGDKILVENHFDGHALETITFADGTTLNQDDILAMV